MGEFEGKLIGWLANLWPAISAMVDVITGLFRRMILGLFGGVAKEDAAADKARQRAPDDPATRPTGELEDWQKVERKRVWAPGLVRQALALTAAGRPLRSLQKDNLPEDVVQWIGEQSEDDLRMLLSLPVDALRSEYDLWEIGGEVLDALAEGRLTVPGADPAAPVADGEADHDPDVAPEPEAPTGPGRRP